MTADQIADRLLSSVPEGVEAETVVTKGNLSLTRFANSFIHQNVSEDGVNIHLRVALDSKVASGGTTRSDDESLQRLVAQTIEVAELQARDELWQGLAPPVDIAPGDHFDEATAGADPAARADLVKRFVDAGGGLSAAGYCSTEGWDVVYASSNGHRATARTSQATLDGIHQTATSAGSGHGTSIRVGDLDADAIGELAARRAADSVAPFDTKPGDYEVVLAPEAVGTIAIFLAAYAFNGKAAVENRSMAKLGEQQFDEQISLRQDPADPRAVSLPFDGEGSPAKTYPLIDRGVSAGLSYDRRVAARAGAETTGNHAYGPSAWFGPIATDLFLEPGSSSVEELIAGVERGLYVSTFNYCRILDEKTMVVTGLTRNGTFMIENGRITDAVTNLRFTQSFAGALAPDNVLGVGDDARYSDNEFAPAITFVPSLRLASWNFTGGASG